MKQAQLLPVGNLRQVPLPEPQRALARVLRLLEARMWPAAYSEGQPSLLLQLRLRRPQLNMSL